MISLFVPVDWMRKAYEVVNKGWGTDRTIYLYFFKESFDMGYGVAVPYGESSHSDRHDYGRELESCRELFDRLVREARSGGPP